VLQVRRTSRCFEPFRSQLLPILIQTTTSSLEITVFSILPTNPEIYGRPVKGNPVRTTPGHQSDLRCLLFFAFRHAPTTPCLRTALAAEAMMDLNAGGILSRVHSPVNVYNYLLLKLTQPKPSPASRTSICLTYFTTYLRSIHHFRYKI
jgi:hypothetical protein